MIYGYYPGCSLNGTAKEFDLSLREVLRVFDSSFAEIKDWCCCGASSAHSMSHLLSVALPAKNLITAKEDGLKEIVAPCAACFNRLKISQYELNKKNELRKSVEELLGQKYNDGIEVLNLISLFRRIGLQEIKARIKRDLHKLNAASYYGCLLVRPAEVLNFDDAENPTSMDEVVAAAGATPVEWNSKVECCGASHSIAHTEIVLNLSSRILDDALNHNANVIVVACPMCHSNLDMRQKNILKQNPDRTEIPVLYLSQIVGLALGLSYRQLGLNLHYINPEPLLDSIEAKEVKL